MELHFKKLEIDKLCQILNKIDFEYFSPCLRFKNRFCTELKMRLTMLMRTSPFT